MEKFLDGVKSDGLKDEAAFTGVPENGQAKVEDDVDPETVPESIKDRRHRRLEAKLQAERESNIRLNERLTALSESERYQRDTTTLGDTEKELLRMYGDTPEGRQAVDIHKALLDRVAEEAEERAVSRMEARQNEAASQQREYESLIDESLENLEDEHNIDLTSDAPSARKARREFLELVEKLSPKDSSGTITDYADFDSTFEMYLSQREKQDNSKQKELASRSMVKSGSSTAQPRQQSRGWDGWKIDAGL